MEKLQKDGLSAPPHELSDVEPGVTTGSSIPFKQVIWYLFKLKYTHIHRPLLQVVPILSSHQHWWQLALLYRHKVSCNTFHSFFCWCCGYILFV